MAIVIKQLLQPQLIIFVREVIVIVLIITQQVVRSFIKEFIAFTTRVIIQFTLNFSWKQELWE